MVPTVAANHPCEVGEGPLWHEAEKRLYWVDLTKGLIFQHDPSTGEHRIFYKADQMIGGFTIQGDGSLLLFMEKGTVAVLRDGNLEYVIRSIPGEESNRFNDVIADPKGRVFCGSMRIDVERNTYDRGGRLYRLERDGALTTILDRTGVSNGIGFSPDNKKMYYTDSLDRRIYVFDYDAETGNISNKQTLITTPDDDSVPDGMTVDEEGYIWSARWDGSALFRYSPEGMQVHKVSFPVKKISSVVFGGSNFTDAYVTTAGGNIRDQDGCLAGSVFRIDLGVKGLPEFTSNIKS